MARRRDRGASWAACPWRPPDALAFAALLVARLVALGLVALAARLVALAAPTARLARLQKAGRRLWLQPAFLIYDRNFRSCRTIISKIS